MFRSFSAQMGRVFHCFGIALLISFAIFFINFYAGLVIFLILFAGMWRVTRPLTYRTPDHRTRYQTRE